MFFSVTLSALAILIKLTSSSPLQQAKLGVHLNRVDNTRIKAIVTNHGDLEASILMTGTFLDPTPIHKVDVFKDGDNLDRCAQRSLKLMQVVREIHPIQGSHPPC